MLLTFSRSRDAFHIPVLLLLVLPLVAVGVATNFQKSQVGSSLMMLALFLGLLLWMLSVLRWISSDGSDFSSRSIFKKNRSVISETALGVNVRRTGKGSYYTVYATDGSSRFDLASAFTRSGADRTRARLEAVFFEQPAQGAALAARRQVEEREARGISQDRAAMAQVNAYYASGTHRRVGTWIAAGVLFYLIAMGIYFRIMGS